MNIEQKVERLRARVKAAFEEFTLVMRLYETWRPAAFDQDLIDRMSHSYAAHAFLLIREALAREIVLGLTKLWDTPHEAIRIERIGDFIRAPAVIRALAVERSGPFHKKGIPGVEDIMELGTKAQAALLIIDRYLPKGPHRAVHDGLHRLRNTRFAHRQVSADAFSAATPTTDEVDPFYKDMSALMRHLMSLVPAVAQDPEEFALVHRRYATEFWAGVRSEKVPGHPSYRAAPSPSTSTALLTGKPAEAAIAPTNDSNLLDHTTDPDEANRRRR